MARPGERPLSTRTGLSMADDAQVRAVARSGHEILGRLRGKVGDRPVFDPGLAGGLRAWLEDAAYDAVARRGAPFPPLVLGPRRLLGLAGEGPQGAPTGSPTEGPDSSSADLLPSLVRMLFRQLVHTGRIIDPLSDALDGLRADGAVPVAERVENLDPSERDILAGSLVTHTANLTMLVPRFAPGWMPRTHDRVAIPLAGGRVVLHGVFDLLVGLPRPPAASLCAVGLSTGGPWPRERRTLHYLALLETLRNGVPPFRLALLDSATGRYGIEDVREEHLCAITSHIAAWLTRQGTADG